jgi:hypothetical protein
MVHCTGCVSVQGEESQTLLYALDGREQYFLDSQVEAQLTVGWYLEPVQMLYAPGKSQVFPKRMVAAQLTVGWYEWPVMYVYAPDGRVKVIKKEELELWKNVGWYDNKTDAIRSFKIQEYPVASQVYYYLIDNGIPEIAACGIIGNLMAETGGNTLMLNPYIGNYYYGLAQWGGGRKNMLLSRYHNPSHIEQAQFILDEMRGTNGVSRQVTEEQYNLIINSTSAQDAALYFAKYYERCASWTYSVRQTNSIIAYNYFIG